VTPEALSELFLLSPIGLLELDGEGRITGASLAARRLLNTLAPESEGLTDLFGVLHRVAPATMAQVRRASTTRGVVLDQAFIPVAGEGVTLSLIALGANRLIGLIADATELSTARADADRLGQQLRALQDGVRDHAAYSLDADGCIVQWSAAAERVHQWRAQEVIGHAATMLFPASTNAEGHLRESLRLAAQNGWCEEEGQRLRQDGTTFWASTVVSALRDAEGRPTGFSVVSHDATDRRRLEERVRADDTSPTDALTGVSSLRSFYDVTQAEVARARRYGQPLTMILIDPDEFRGVVDRQGQEFGEEWMRTLAGICRQESRTTDVVGRVGGEGLAVLLPSTELGGGLVLGERIRERMQRHVVPDHVGSRLTVSVGVAEVSDAVASVDALLEAASTAVDRARKSGMNLVVAYDA
jgi:diguanylate cyclase (GGDEF)-like protein/PAS domain S-box-containing protein